MSKAYLGDGIYVEVGNFIGEFILTTENGIETTNKIIMDDNHITRLMEYVRVTYERSGVKR